eukprot:2388704-Pyramimonas_sp.AAC.1
MQHTDRLPYHVIVRINRLRFLTRLVEHAPLLLCAALQYLSNPPTGWVAQLVRDLQWLSLFLDPSKRPSDNSLHTWLAAVRSSPKAFASTIKTAALKA